MPSYLQLAQEPEWGAEKEAPAHAAFNERLRNHFSLSKAECGSKGDNRHLRGRHRSRAWCLNSIYCTNRTYSTTDSRDRAGDKNWLSATDVGITGKTLQDACRRLDEAVRAGQLPFVAEWFGTIDGRVVVGWSNGHAASSDSSHLGHLHLGIWRGQCDDAAQFQLLGDIITGTTGGTPMLGLKKGDTGNEVKLLQVMLKNSGHDPGPIDGKYGQSTADALLALRQSVGSSATNGDTVTPDAHEQLYRVHAMVHGKPGPKGEDGKDGVDGKDGLGFVPGIPVVGTFTATA